MFKILVALSLFLAIQGQLPGGFTPRPDLIDDPTTKIMVKLAVTKLAESENVAVSPLKVISVESQVVNGINFRIVFTAHPRSSDSVVLCTSKVYQSFQGQRVVSSVSCA